MLLTYLFKNFTEEATLLREAQISATDLSDLTQKRVMPKPSYIVENKADVTSFVMENSEIKLYRFHLKGHVKWLEAVQALNLDTEARAKAHFQSEYENAATVFFSDALGASILAIMPHLAKEFDAAHFDATWAYFLEGVYGVCTRNGTPENIFLKQACVRFIDYFTEAFLDAQISPDRRETILATVDFLDKVESNFAPHEVSITSRQRCIIDVRKRWR
ncbi:MAG: DUF6058 family natural product biosynthesis protein [Paracoccaceae bacterium]